MESVTILDSAARTDTTTVSAAVAGAKGAVVYLDVTAITGTSPTLDVKIQRVSPVGSASDLHGAAFAQVTGTGSQTLSIYPGIAETANQSVSDVVGPSFRVQGVIGTDTATATWRVTAQLVD